MQTLGGERVRLERQRYAVEEVRGLITAVYRGFVAWASLYGDVDHGDERERAERVAGLLTAFPDRYLPRSLWLTQGTRKKIEYFVERSETLHSRLAIEIGEKGYPKVRKMMTSRVSRQLGPLKREVESALEEELLGPRPSKWRTRLKRS